MQTRRRAENRLFRDITIATNSYSDGGRRCGGGWIICRGVGGRRAVEVTADNGICLNDCFSAEDDTLGSVDLRAAGDFVARVLSWLAGGFLGV